MKRDLMNNINPVEAIPHTVLADNTEQSSPAIDVRDIKSVTFVIHIGDVDDEAAEFAVKVMHGDDTTVANHTEVDARDLLGTTDLAGFAFGDSGDTRKIGYVGDKDYVSLEITPTGVTTNAEFSALVILEPYERPADNPPA